MSTAPVLVDLRRNGVVESRHAGRLVVLDSSGAVDVALGDVGRPVFGRSALKPLQATALVNHGWSGRDAALALAGASHSAEPRHLHGVRAILAGAGLDEGALQCPPDLPPDLDQAGAYLAAGGTRARICHSCSGKHAAMLSTCVVNGWDTATYLDPAHPLQRAIVTAIEARGGETIAATGVDGCGAPAHAISLIALARGFAALASGQDEAAVAVSTAARNHPELTGGNGRPVTELGQAVPGLIGKDGAEGVWAAALPDGRSMALKIEDGSDRPAPAVVVAVLRHWGVPADETVLDRWAARPVLGGGQPVGTISASAELIAALR